MGESCRAWGVIIPGGIDLFLACLIVLDELQFFAFELELLLGAKQLPELTWSCGPLGANHYSASFLARLVDVGRMPTAHAKVIHTWSSIRFG